MLLKIDVPTEDGYEFCKTYIKRFDKVPRVWTDDETQLEIEVKQGTRDHDFIHIPENTKRWFFLIIAERYIDQYETHRKRTIELPLRHKSDIPTQKGDSASQSKTGGKFQSVNIAGDGPVSSKGQVSGSGLCVKTRSSHITCRRPSKKRSIHRRRRSSKARQSRKSRATRRR